MIDFLRLWLASLILPADYVIITQKHLDEHDCLVTDVENLIDAIYDERELTRKVAAVECTLAALDQYQNEAV